MSQFVITVDFHIKHGSMPAFRALIDTNAIESCSHEPGCQRFDVAIPQGSNDRVFLYEIYDDRAAFDAHTKTPHFKTFNDASQDMVLSKEIRQLDLVCEASTHKAKK